MAQKLTNNSAVVYKLLFVDYLPNDGSHHFLTALTSVFEAGFVTFTPSFKRFNVSSQICIPSG